MPDFSPTHIRSVYIDLCKDPVFSINLRIPTDARIKRECKDLYKKKNTLSDKQIVRNFLQLSDEIEIESALKKVNADKFKPVVNFLKDVTKDPRNETIELVAWLINFRFELGKAEKESDESEDSNKEDNELQIIGNTSRNEDPSIQSEPDSDSINSAAQELLAQPETKDFESQIEIVGDPIIVNQRKTRPSFLNIFLITIIILLIEAGALFLWRNYTDRISVPAVDERCMYWAGTHYEPIKCEDIKGDLPVIHLDLKKLNNLKKIYLSDTLTQKSLGKVWYSSVDKKHEFFTDSGMHPVDTVKRLRPLTSYILTNHTSSHRFILNVIALVCCSILGAILFAFGVDHLIRKQKNKRPVKTD